MQLKRNSMDGSWYWIFSDKLAILDFPAYLGDHHTICFYAHPELEQYVAKLLVELGRQFGWLHPITFGNELHPHPLVQYNYRFRYWLRKPYLHQYIIRLDDQQSADQATRLIRDYWQRLLSDWD